MFEHWSYYTSMEDMDSNRTWVVHGYERLKKTRWRLLEDCFTKTKSYKLMETAQSDLQQPILVTPAMSFKQSQWYDELRTKLRQLLVQMRNSLLCSSAQAFLRQIHSCVLQTTLEIQKSNTRWRSNTSLL